MKMLVAEDDPVSLRRLQAYLAEWGYEVTSVTDGQEALEILQAPDSPRLAILNWVLPGMNGIDVCREIRKRARRPYTYILILTAKIKKEALVEAWPSGADDYLAKPLNPHELRARLRTGRRTLDLRSQLLSAYRLIQTKMTVDPLTRVWSRNVILDILKRQLILSSHSDSPMGLMFVNIDHLKNINGTFGPFAGDTILREVVRRIRVALRPPDSIGRSKADEFVIVLPGCDAPTAATLAEKFRTRVDRRAFDTSEGMVPVTVSLGVVVAPAKRALDLNVVWRLAAEAVARAKANGRNRVEFATL
jgi:diguanylate cyclase (GGDEF)-like protein